MWTTGWLNNHAFFCISRRQKRWWDEQSHTIYFFNIDLYENGAATSTCDKLEEFSSQLDSKLRRQLGINRCLVTLGHLQLHVRASCCTRATQRTLHITVALFFSPTTHHCWSLWAERTGMNTWMPLCSNTTPRAPMDHQGAGAAHLRQCLGGGRPLQLIWSRCRRTRCVIHNNSTH